MMTSAFGWRGAAADATQQVNTAIAAKRIFVVFLFIVFAFLDA
jgi:hypothetical protein